MTKQTKQTTNKVNAFELAQAEVARLQYGDDCSKESVNKAVESAVKAVRSGRQAVQKAAVLILLRAYKHGDYSAATQLVEQLGNGVNGKALVAWFQEFGGLRTKDGEVGFIGWRGAEYIEQRFDKAKATPWWTMKQQNPWKGFDVNEHVERLIKQYRKAADRVKDEPELKDKVQFNIDSTLRLELLALLGE